MVELCLPALQARWGSQVDQEIERWLAVASDVRQFADMMRYQLEFVDEHGASVQTARSKRFRPLLCLLACQAVVGETDRALTVAAAIELLHNFSLIHDDIQDGDETRRHRPTVWKQWGEAQGINVGDGMFALASRASVDTSQDPQVSLDVARRFQCTTLLLTEGQYLDMSFEVRPDVQVAEYIDMISKKTGALIEFSVWSGARVGGARRDIVDGFATFGLELGKAFQVYDDIQGIWATTDVTGKQVAKDLLNRKKTLPVLLAMAAASPTEKSALNAFLCHATDDVARIVELLNRTGARESAERVLLGHLQAALRTLHQLNIDEGSRQELEQLARELTSQRPAAI